MSENFFRLSAKNLQKVVKTTFCVTRRTICSLNFFLKFWIVSDFLQKPLAWFSKVYLCVQSKNCGKKSFFLSFFRVFSIFGRKFFSLLAKKLQENVKTTFCVSTGTTCDFISFKKSFEPFWIFYRNLWHGSQNSIYVSRVKISEETVFLFFFWDFFRIISENFFRLSAKKLQKVVKTTFYVSRGTVCGLKFKFFSKILNRFGFSAETIGMILKILSTCPEQKFRRKHFSYFSFQNFSDFERIFFQTFGEKSSKSCQNYLLRDQTNNL